MSFMYKLPLPKAAPVPPTPSETPPGDSLHNDIQSSILVFPSRAPSEPPASPLAPDLRRGSTSLSIPTSLISSVEGRSPQSSNQSESGWDESDSDPRPRLGCVPPPEPLTRDRLAQLQRGGQENWRARRVVGDEQSASDDVEVWEWTATSAQPSGPSVHAPSSELSSLLQGRRPLPQRGIPELDSSSASSELHFFSTDDSDDDFSSIFLVTLNPSSHPIHGAQPEKTNHRAKLGKLPARRAAPLSIFNDTDEEEEELTAVSYYSPKLLRLPFESILRFIFDLDPSTLRLLKQQNARPHPDNPFSSPPTDLFDSTVTFETNDETAVAEGRRKMNPTSLVIHRRAGGSSSILGENSSASTSIKRGMETLNQFPEAPVSPHAALIGMARLPILLAKAILRV